MPAASSRPARSRAALLSALISATALFAGCAAPPGSAVSEHQEVIEDFATTVLSQDDAQRRWRHDPSDRMAAIWLSRHLGYAGEYAEAIDVLTRCLEHHPGDARLLRHRGHRFISYRRYADAISDLSLAARSIEGTADEVEPDGRPNAAGIPLSTLHTNIYYHLGLAHYLAGQFPQSMEAFAHCLESSPNDDMRVASAYWLSLCLIQNQRPDDARRVAAAFSEPDLEIIENRAYHRLLGLIAGRIPYDMITGNLDPEDWTAVATDLYGVGMWHVLNGRTAEAVEVFRAVTSGPVSSAFGRLASEVEAGRITPALE